MKLAVITDEISQDFEHALDVMLEYGVRGAELRGLWGSNIADLDASQINRARRALVDRGMTVVGLATPIYKCELGDVEAKVQGAMHLAIARDRSEQLELLRKCVRIGRELECNQLRVFAFWNRGRFTEHICDQIVEAFVPLVSVAAEESVKLVLENEHACYVGTGAEVAEIVSRVDSANLRVCWDPGNSFMAGETPFPNGYSAVKTWIGHVHVKDVRSTGNEISEWAVIGQGDIDYTGQFAALERDNYEGWVSLETHYIPKTGSAEDGSRACLRALRNYIKD